MKERLSDRIRVAARVQPHRERHRQLDELATEVRAFEDAAADREKYNADGWEEADLARARAESKAEAFEGENERLRGLLVGRHAAAIDHIARLRGVVNLADHAIDTFGDYSEEENFAAVRLYHAARADLRADFDDIGAGAGSTTSGSSRAPGSSESAPPAPPTPEAER